MSVIGVTGATGQLGRLVVAQLLKNGVPANRIVALVRTPSKAADLGVRAVEADYSKPDTLDSALKGVNTLLLISSNEIGKRAEQHLAVIKAAKTAGVQHLAYTSLLFASSTPVGKEHAKTEAALKTSGLKYTVLRNGWYNENFLHSLGGALAAGAWIGSSGEGKFSTAAVQDFAEAAAVVLAVPEKHVNATYELAGDSGFTKTELTAEVSKLSGKNIPYVNLSQADYYAALTKVGLPAVIADLFSTSDSGASKGGLFDDSKTLSKLIGHATTPISVTLAAAIKKA